MDNIKLVLILLIFFVSGSGSAFADTYPAKNDGVEKYSLTRGFTTYFGASAQEVCTTVASTLNDVSYTYYGTVSGVTCYYKKVQNNVSAGSGVIVATFYICNGGGTLSGSSCINAVACSSDQYRDTSGFCVSDPICSATEQLINHQCVADPTCSATEQLINHQCVADPTCSSTEQLINHQCVADPVCSSTEQLINHQCVADPICSSTEQLINHQCVADPVCSSTEQLINHQCVADPVCSSTEQLINHQCVADPTCSTTELLINHQCVANQNLAQNNGDPGFFHNPQSVYYTQTVVGTTLVTKLDTPTGAILETQANDIPITPYVGLYWDSVDGYLYYSYKTQIDVGSGEKIPVSFKRRLSYESMADMMVWFELNTAEFTASNNYFQWLSDFFINRAEAFLPALAALANVMSIVYYGADIYKNVAGFFKKAPEGSMTGECFSSSNNGITYGSPQAVCDAIPITSHSVAEMIDATRFRCMLPTGAVGGGGCGSLGPTPDESISPGVASTGVAVRIENGSKLGKLAGKADTIATMIDIGKAIYDAYKKFTHTSPSSKKPLGDTPMPSTPRDYEPSFDKPAPPDLSKDNKTKADPVDLTKSKGGSTQTKPDGSQIKKDEQIRIKSDPEFPDSIVSEGQEITVEISPDGTMGSPTVEKRAPESSWEPDYSGDNNDPPPADLCAKDPTIIACSHWGKPEPPDEIKTHEMDISLDPGGSSSGSCPADKQAHTRYGVIPISFSPVCQASGFIKPVFIALAWLGAGFILFGTVKD